MMLNLIENKEDIVKSPVPPLWKTDRRGKIYVYDKYWNNLLKIIKNNKKFEITREKISKIIQVNEKSIRKWSNQNIKPNIYTKEEFSFTNQNLYWLGLFYSDGHLRNNGSYYSYTYQTDSSNIFQGYWFAQFIQRHLSIFKHKKKDSITSIITSDKKNWCFKTNLSGISPIFMEFLKNKDLIKKGNNTKTTGFQKNLTKECLNTVNKEILFQGIFDGDGHYSSNKNKSITISLALNPEINPTYLIKELPLIPTLCILPDRKTKIYENEEKLLDIRLAPTSINKLNQNIYSIKDIVNQLEFMLKAAQHSIRPDKVHKLIKIVNRICSKEYGENTNSIPIQRKIRDSANKRNLKEKAKQLERQYPIKDNKYLSFQPLWTKGLCSKKEWFSEAWYFFFNLKNLNFKNYPNKEKFNFEEGVPIDFKL